MAWVQRFFDGFKGSRFRVSERIIIMITINLEFSKWPEMFKDATLVAALVDCLTYHSHFLNMNANRIASKMRAKGSRSFLRSTWLRNSRPCGSLFH